MKILCLIPAVGFWRVNGKVMLDRKFYDGVECYKKIWTGKFRVIIRESDSELPVYGLVEIDEEKSTTEFILISNNGVIKKEYLQDSNIVMASCDDFRNFNVAKLCNDLNVTCVYDLEYTVSTRMQINILSDEKFIKKIKTALWLFLNEKKRVRSLMFADALQANGMPAFNGYKKYFKNDGSALFYFDNRVSKEMLISRKNLNDRLDRLDSNSQIRLAFSGRIISIKGVCDLVDIANFLRNNNVNFYFDIFGEGNLIKDLNDRIKNLSLINYVKLHGAVDFETKLIPFIQSNVDIFVCCHKQGDPSCTYLETYACGVPIVGYNNEAHSGILKVADVGWEVPLGESEKLANLIIKLNSDRKLIKEKSINAWGFASMHTFESEFQKRVEQFHYLN